MHTTPWTTKRLAGLSALCAGLAACGGGVGPAPPPSIQILSADPAMVTGGDVLVSLALQPGQSATGLKLTLNGNDVTAQLKTDATGATWRGVVAGLTAGQNTLQASTAATSAATLAVVNHAAGAPIFSGPQLQPWVCTTAQAGLGAPLDTACNATPSYRYVYRSKASNSFVAYNPASPPAASDIATTTTDQGRTVNYIVRIETGSVNRSLYEIAVLFDPTQSTDPLGWNRKVYIPLQGGFGHAFSQSLVRSNTPQEAILNDMALRRGFIVTKTTFLQAATNMDWVRGAESLLMLKERIAEQYGQIRYTFSSGASGGSMMQNLIANSYPGLLQGIIPMAEFVDFWSAGGPEAMDCIQLKSYFTQNSALWPTAAQRAAVFGHIDETTCNFYATNFPGSLDPTRAGSSPLSPEVAASLLYHPTANPTGARGVQQDYQVNYFGRRSASQWTAAEQAAGQGFARSPHDNVGVQFGLKALLEGKLDAEQFVDLNEKLGGMDIDFKPTAARHARDPEVGALLYRTGFINDVRNHDKVAIISVRLPDVDPIASHSLVHSFILGDRLAKAGHSANRVLWLIPGYQAALPHELSFVAMDRWLTAVEADKVSGTLPEKIVRNKPADVVNGCWAPGSTSITLENVVKDLNQCTSTWYPVSALPRIVAANGNREATFVGKCQLKPLVRGDYSVSFSDAQWTRLQSAFPAGVCDWSKPDAALTPSVPWLGFAGGPGGQPLTVTLPPAGTP